MENAPLQPVQQPVSDTPVTGWEEPHREPIKINGKNRTYLMAVTGGIAVALIAVAIWQKNFTFAMGAVVVISAAVALLMQAKHGDKARTIAISRQYLTIDEKKYPLQNLAGFWLERDGEHLVINVESKKPTLVPISFFYPSLNSSEARQVLTQVLAEVEPRFNQTNGINRYFRF